MPSAYAQTRNIVFLKGVISVRSSSYEKHDEAFSSADRTFDWFLGREIEQTITLRDIEAIGDRVGRIRARRKQGLPIAAS